MQTFIIVTFMTLGLAFASPLDLGRGGVYNSPAAQDYWARRFGRGFFTNLASIQRNINTVAEQNRATLDTKIPDVGITEEEIESGNDITRNLVEMNELPSILTIQPGPLFFGQVHF